MFGRKDSYYTFEDERDLQNVAKDHGTIGSTQKFNRGAVALVMVGLCVIILLVVILVPVIVVKNTHEKTDNPGLQCPEVVSEHVDCYPEGKGPINQDTCHNRGCCWLDDVLAGTPRCFFPSSYGYSVENVKNTSAGMVVLMEKTQSKLPYPGEVLNLKLEAFYETDYRLRVKVGVLLSYCHHIRC